MKSITFSFSRIQINISSKIHEAFPNSNSIWNIIRVLRTSASWVNKLQLPVNYSDYNYVFPAASKMQNISIATKSNWLQTCSRQESLSPFSWMFLVSVRTMIQNLDFEFKRKPLLLFLTCHRDFKGFSIKFIYWFFIFLNVITIRSQLLLLAESRFE